MRRLLVVEDDADSLEMLAALLEAGGYEVTARLTTKQAMAALERDTYDLILADLLIDSRQLDESWRRLDLLVKMARPAEVGLITGWLVSKSEADAHGVSFVIRKPSTREELFSFLAAALHLPALPESRARLLATYFKAIEERTFDVLGSICTDDIVYRLPGPDARFCTEIRGKNEFLPFTARTFEAFPDTRFDIKSMRPLPAGAIVEYVGTWRDGTQERSMPGAVMFELRDAAISRIEVRVPTEELR